MVPGQDAGDEGEDEGGVTGVSERDFILSRGQQANDAVGSRQGDGNGGAGAFLGGEGKGAGVVFDDAADDEEPQAVAFALGGAEGFIHGAHDFVGDTGAGVGDDDAEVVVVVGGLDVDASVLSGDGLVGIADEIIERLEELGGIG